MPDSLHCAQKLLAQIKSPMSVEGYKQYKLFLEKELGSTCVFPWLEEEQLTTLNTEDSAEKAWEGEK